MFLILIKSPKQTFPFPGLQMIIKILIVSAASCNALITQTFASQVNCLANSDLDLVKLGCLPPFDCVLICLTFALRVLNRYGYQSNLPPPLSFQLR